MKNNSLTSLNLGIFFMLADFWNSNLIGYNKIGNGGAKVIAEALMKNNSFTSLNLGIFFIFVDFWISNLIVSNNIGEEDAEAISELLGRSRVYI